MPRLPQPGADAGHWGDILNDYLSQSHTSDGSLKDSSVTSSVLAPNSVTSSAIASDAVTAAALADDSVTAATIADGTIQEAQLSSAVSTKLNAPAIITDGSVTKTKLEPNVQVSLSRADSALQSAPITSVNTKTGDVTISKSDIGLNNVDNTSDTNKPISTATQTALNARYTLPSGGVPLSDMKKGDLDAVYASLASPTFTGIVAGISTPGVVNANEQGVLTSLTNCATALQLALNTAASAGKALFMPKGIYTLGSSITIPSNTRWYGERGTVVKLANSFPTAHPIANGTTQLQNVHISDLEFDGNAANQSGDQTANGTPNEIIFLSSSSSTLGSNIIIERVYEHDSYRLGIVLQNITDFAIRDCRIVNNGRDGISLFDACSRGAVVRNRINGCNDDHIALDGEAAQMSDIVVANNVISGPGYRGLGKGIRIQAVRNVTVTGNMMDNLSEDGIRINDWGAYGIQQVTITGNTISGSGSGGSGSKVGIIVVSGYANYPASRTSYASIVDLVIAENTVFNCGGNGIELRTDHADDELARIKVRGNIVSQCTGEGISFTTASSASVCDTDISENTCYLNSGHGIFANLGKRTRVCGNTAYNKGTGGVNTTGIRLVSSDIIIATGNLAYETRTSTARTQTIGVYLNASGATSVLVKDNLTYGMNTGWSHNNVPGLAVLEGVYGKVPVLKQGVSGSRGSNAALQSLITALVAYGVITDSTTA